MLCSDGGSRRTSWLPCSCSSHARAESPGTACMQTRGYGYVGNACLKRALSLRKPAVSRSHPHATQCIASSCHHEPTCCNRTIGSSGVRVYVSVCTHRLGAAGGLSQEVRTRTQGNGAARAAPRGRPAGAPRGRGSCWGSTAASGRAPAAPAAPPQPPRGPPARTTHRPAAAILSSHEHMREVLTEYAYICMRYSVA